MSLDRFFVTTLTVRRTPYCPSCTEPLHSGGVSFVRGYAFCKICAESTLLRPPMVLPALASLDETGHLSTAAGLTFFTPKWHEPVGAIGLVARLHE